jgi:acyl-CoA reductase-like NAD-dependent aldehyde dehydrogenase
MGIMSRSVDERIGDVRRLLAAARELRSRRAALVPAIVDSTGLSPEGVDLAFQHHLEVEASADDLERLVARAGDAEHVSVVLSANVFVGALRAIAVARAAAPSVVVRPSRRDPAFARALVEAAADRAIVLDEGFDVAKQDRGEIHVYGRDETIADVRAKARVRVRAHGSGMGVAWITAKAELAAAARGVADDVVVFDQRGCLSPRVVLVEGDTERAAELASALHAELERLDASVPRGAVPAEDRAACGRYVATMTYASQVLVGGDHAIGIAPPAAPLVLPPAYRHVHVAACFALSDAEKLLAPLAKGIAAFGSDDLDAARAIANVTAPRARLALLGRMQRPPLDGPVDLRDA